MTRSKYLADLEKMLYPLSEDERAEALRFYTEYFDEAGPEKEQDVIKELGAPAYVAAQVISRIGDENTGKEKQSVKRNFSALWVMLLGVLAAPVAFPVLLGILIVLFVFAVVGLSLLFSLAVTGIGLAFGGIASFFSSFGLIASGPAEMLFNMGAGLVCFSIGAAIILLMGCCARGIFNLFMRLINLVIKKENKK